MSASWTWLEAKKNSGTTKVNLDEPNLSNQTSDYLALVAKGAFGWIPFAGPILAEIAGTVIPNQRSDRLKKFVEELEPRLAELEQASSRVPVEDESFTDLVEEGFHQAVRSLSDERRAYLASIITNSVSHEEIEFQESKHLMRLLGEINDIEVIWLRFHAHRTMGGDEEFRSKHEEILGRVHAFIGSSQDDVDRSTLQDSYWEHLVSLGLLERQYRSDIRTREPEFDKTTGAQVVRGYQITRLGSLLLRHIGLSNSSLNKD